jgi:hypothetical protein
LSFTGNSTLPDAVGKRIASMSAASARNIERVDKLVQTVAAQKGMRLPEVDAIVARVDAWLARNRSK